MELATIKVESFLHEHPEEAITEDQPGEAEGADGESSSHH